MKLATIRKALVALVPFVTTLVLYFAGADSDAYFITLTAVGALTAAGVYVTPNTSA